MNKLFTKITSLALGAAMMIGVGVSVGSKYVASAEAAATEVTFTPGTDTGDTTVTKNGVTVVLTSMNNSSYYQIYAKQSGTISVTSGNVTKIEFSCTASGTNKYGPGKVSANVGSYSYSGKDGTWTGSSNSVTLSSTAQVRMTTLKVSYEGGATYTVNYYPGTGATGTIPSDSGASITLKGWSDISSVVTPPTNKAFSGWNTSADGSGTAYAAGTKVTSSIDLYAQWADAYSVTYTAGANGTGSYAHTMQPAGQYSLLQFAELTGVSANSKYQFKNYTVNNVDYDAGDTITISGATSVTVNFEPEPQRYQITFTTDATASDVSNAIDFSVYTIPTGVTLDNPVNFVYGATNKNLKLNKSSGNGSSFDVTIPSTLDVTTITIKAAYWSNDSTAQLKIIPDGGDAVDASSGDLASGTFSDLTFNITSSNVNKFTVSSPVGGKRVFIAAMTINYASADPYIEYSEGGTSASLTVINSDSNSLTFEAKNFSSVSADLFSCSPVTGTHSSLKFTVSGTTVTVTATGTSVGGPDSYTISATGCENTLSLEVTVQSSTTFDSLVISTPTSSTIFNEGDAFAVTDMVVTANFTIGGSPATETFSADSGAEHALSDLTFTVGENVMKIGDSLSSTGSLSVVVSYTDSVTGTTQSATAYSITVNAYVPHTWTLVTSAPTDWRGTYLLGYEHDGTFYAFNSGLTTFDATFNTVNTTDVTEGVVTGSKELDAVAVKIERNTISEKSYYHAKCANGEYLKSASKSIDHQATASTSVAVTFDGVSLKIGDFWLRFNTASNQLRFRFGNESYLSDTSASLYKMDVTSSINTEVSNYATSFLSKVTCSGQGSIVKDGWSDMSTAFAALSVDAQGILANTVGDKSGSGVTGAVGRYDEIVVKHGDDHADFMDRFVEGAINYGLNRNNINPISLFTSENTGTVVIIIVSVIGISALGGFFFLRKRKEI